MSKDELKSDDKWRELAEREEAGEVAASAKMSVDDEHLLSQEEPAESADNALRDKLNLLEKQVEFLKDQHTRSQAELENVRRRMEQEVSKARKFGVEKLVADLVPVAESLSRGLEGEASNDPSVKLIRQGAELTLGMLLKLMEKNGVVTVNPEVGTPFDPNQHEAMSMVQVPDAKSNTVLQVLQKGYALHGRIIKAAMVIVAA